MPIATLGVFIALAAAAPWLVGDGGIGLLFEVLLMLAMAQLWNLLAGYTGLVSMGLQCFVGLGGYTTIFAANTLSVSPYWVLPLAPHRLRTDRRRQRAFPVSPARCVFLDQHLGVRRSRRHAGVHLAGAWPRHRHDA